MTLIKHFALILALTFFGLTAMAEAQTARLSTVNVTSDGARVHIAAQGDISEMRIDVADEQGEVVFQSGAISGQTLDWKMTDAQGERVAAGIYLVTVTFRTAAGKLRKRVEQVSVDEVEKHETQQTAAAAPEAVQATITGAGTNGKIAKFTGTATIANSVITETAGNIGIGVAPRAGIKLTMNGPALVTAGTNKEVQLGSPNTEIGMSFKFPYTSSITNRADIRFNGDTLTLSAGNGTGIPAAANGMVVTRLGTVGIGTTNPYGKLHVLANNGYSLYSRNDSGFAIYGISSSGYAGFFEGKAKVTGTLEVGSCVGCTMTSDQNLKTNFSSINPRLVLDRLAALPIRQWNYKADDSSIRHIGPMAQDFRTAFNLGADDKHIDMIDANGVTMAAIQGLYQMSMEQNKELTNQIKEQSRQIKQLQTRLARVERTAHKNNSHRRRAAR